MSHTDRCGICRTRGHVRVMVEPIVIDKVTLPTGTVRCDWCGARQFPPERAKVSSVKT